MAIQQQVILFGATGDLAKSKLLPQLSNLAKDEQLQDWEVVAVGRQSLNTAEYLDLIDPQGQLHNLPVRYQQVDFVNPNGFRELLTSLTKDDSVRKIFYLSVGPDVIDIILDRFCDEEECHIQKYFNVAVAAEKPFGSDVATAEAINKKLLQFFTDEQIKRVDHYRQKTTAQKLLIRAPQLIKQFGGWQEIKHVTIFASELNLVGGRAAGYYDSAGGAINDWLQNHLMQLLINLGCHIYPQTDNLSSSRHDFLQSFRADLSTLKLGQYEGYNKSEGVKADTHTETFAAIDLHSSLKDIEHIRFTLTSGKGLAAKSVGIKITLQDNQEIIIPIDPSSEDDLLGANTFDAYYNVWKSLLNNDNRDFITQKEIEAQWAIIEGINEAKEKQQITQYAVGSDIWEVLNIN